MNPNPRPLFYGDVKHYGDAFERKRKPKPEYPKPKHEPNAGIIRHIITCEASQATKRNLLETNKVINSIINDAEKDPIKLRISCISQDNNMIKDLSEFVRYFANIKSEHPYMRTDVGASCKLDFSRFSNLPSDTLISIESFHILIHKDIINLPETVTYVGQVGKFIEECCDPIYECCDPVWAAFQIILGSVTCENDLFDDYDVLLHQIQKSRITLENCVYNLENRKGSTKKSKNLLTFIKNVLKN
uniref:Uncharacterized protein n=1 Tax=viral metagenome TaxID=1070528 RepID=A0A6C0EA35_9ZZZZ